MVKPYEIVAYGCSELFGEVAFEIALSEGLLHRHAHLDTTSLSVHGQYKKDDEAQTIEITYGHSKDHHSDLKRLHFTEHKETRKLSDLRGRSDG